MPKHKPKDLEERATLMQGDTTVSIVGCPALNAEQKLQVVEEYCRLGYITVASLNMVERARRDYWSPYNSH